METIEERSHATNETYEKEVGLKQELEYTCAFVAAVVLYSIPVSIIVLIPLSVSCRILIVKIVSYL